MFLLFLSPLPKGHLNSKFTYRAKVNNIKLDLKKKQKWLVQIRHARLGHNKHLPWIG